MVTAQTTSLLDTLLAKKALNKAQYDKVKFEEINTGKSQEELLEEHNFVSETDLARAKASLYNVPYLGLKEIVVSPEALNLVPESVAQRYKAFPFEYNKAAKTLKVVMANPLDLTGIEFLEKKSGCKILLYIGPASKISETIEEKYAQSLSTEVTQVLKETGGEEPKVRVVDAAKMGKVIREAPIAKIVTTLLEFAIKGRASDVHIEPQEGRTRVRYRIDGILHEKLVLPKNIHDALISRIKILSDMKIDERRLPQDGRFNFRSGEEEVDLRVSCVPSSHGEKIVMRLLKKTGKIPSLPELGLRGSALKNLERAIRVPHGIVLVTGPTGSGKTTTLYSVLSLINTPRVNIITLEDPVEYAIGGVTQVQVNPQAGLTFASGLRSFLRQDPDIIMVGEIRDQETTELAIQAALTGHLVFSTLHTNSAAGALPRLFDMKAAPFLLASSMNCVVGQRVVRKVCEKCKEEYNPPVEVVADIKKVLGELFKEKQGMKLHRGKKCEACNNTGYLGRIGIFEVLYVTEKIEHLVLEGSSASKMEEQAMQDGMIIMKQDGYLKALEGITTIEEVLRVAEVQ